MLSGSIVALATPMTTSGEVDYQNLASLVEFHIEQGTDGIVAVGTTGESCTLPVEEHVEVVKKVVAAAAGRVPVIAGNGANSTSESVALTKALEGTGVVAMLGVVPYYNKPPQRGLVAHFKTVAAATSVPQILYNVPGRTCCDLMPETVAELAQVENIIGIKEATGNLSRLHEIKALCDDQFLTFSGDDSTGMEFMLQGGNGVISVTNNIAPKQMAQMCAHALAGEREQAEAIDKQLQGLHDNLFVEANPIPVKWCMHQLGLIKEGQLRLPLVELSKSYQPQLSQAMTQAGLL